jgi:hypothetical protein
VTDDAYLCAVRDAKPKSLPKPPSDEVSWGKVFAYALRQPLLAQSLGMIYTTTLKIEAAYFPKGGWLYVDLAQTSDYRAQQQVNDKIIVRYAARLPALIPGKPRPVFAPVQFPVAPTHVGNYDNILIETADYDDGFAKIVHAFQPVSTNLLAEAGDGLHPTKEAGIRLGWDDEQILIWYLRQMSEDASAGSGKRIDAPLGVFGYRIDVKGNNPGDTWASLNEVSNKVPLQVNGVPLLGDFKEKELNYQVYPTLLDGDTAKNYWLPMYFANWNGKSMVLQDQDAAKIYQHQKVKVETEINVKAPPENNLNKIYDPVPDYPPLRYGNIYHFRVRLGDMSGGGPETGVDPVNESAAQEARVHFKRYVAPSTLRIADLPVNTDGAFFPDNEIKIKRPLLGYPAVVYTGKYADPVALLTQASIDMANQEAFGIADPDVERVEITVEVQTLKMDNLLSLSGQEPYIKLYATTRKFPKASPLFDDELVVPLDYRDCHVLKFGDPGDLGDLGVTQAQIDAMNELVLPTARTIRLTVRALCEKKNDYYGLENPNNSDLDTRYGRITQFLVKQDAAEEGDLFIKASPGKTIQGIYLQPDPPFLVDGALTSILLGKEVQKPPDMIQRLAQQLGLESKGLTLVGKKGARIQFGCSQRIRHTLSPENASITFASKADLMNHWLSCLVLDLERDWTWDALADRSFVVQRQQSFEGDGPAAAAKMVEIGDIEMKRTAPFNALANPERGVTRLIFIDAVEPKKDPQQPAFPDTIELLYTMTAYFKDGSQKDFPLPVLSLPITTPPAQVPKIAAAGLALSPYVRNDAYSKTEPRRRFLWIEFEEPVQDPQDAFFARVLTYGPDQLISNNHPDLLAVPDGPALPVDPELIRVITPEQPNDEAGLDAMQLMEAETGVASPRHYLLPLPSGLHAESPEMFGFFTYEFRVGHYRHTKDAGEHKAGDNVWTTAQGRFGRALKTAGVQHPAPTLTCTVNRDEEKLYVTAPYAVAVANGKNVTADPPRTELWCLLYAQVKQADSRDFRNVLLDDKMLDWRVKVEHRKKVDWQVLYTEKQEALLKQVVIKNWKTSLDIGALAHMYQLADASDVNKDATKYGTVIWTNNEVNQLLTLYGLPLDADLSVLCVEILPHITNIYDQVSGLKDQLVQEKLRTMLQTEELPTGILREGVAMKAMAADAVSFTRPKPLSDKLGYYRILRTSPLAAVPFVCCAEC